MAGDEPPRERLDQLAVEVDRRRRDAASCGSTAGAGAGRAAGGGCAGSAPPRRSRARTRPRAGSPRGRRLVGRAPAHVGEHEQALVAGDLRAARVEAVEVLGRLEPLDARTCAAARGRSARAVSGWMPCRSRSSRITAAPLPNTCSNVRWCIRPTAGSSVSVRRCAASEGPSSGVIASATPATDSSSGIGTSSSIASTRRLGARTAAALAARPSRSSVGASRRGSRRCRARSDRPRDRAARRARCRPRPTCARRAAGARRAAARARPPRSRGGADRRRRASGPTRSNTARGDPGQVREHRLGRLRDRGFGRGEPGLHFLGGALGLALEPRPLEDRIARLEREVGQRIGDQPRSAAMRSSASSRRAIVAEVDAAAGQRVDAREAAEHEAPAQLGRRLRREQAQQRALERVGGRERRDAVVRERAEQAGAELLGQPAAALADSAARSRAGSRGSTAPPRPTGRGAARG